MNKEIIIDGVDVAGCKLYDYGICDSEMAENLNCEQNPNCYFKQLKRLQKENEELRKLECKFKEYCTCDTEKYKQALEEIREIAEELITELPEYHSCYYKDECGRNCTPKKQSKVEYCCYENVDNILETIDEVLDADSEHL